MGLEEEDGEGFFYDSYGSGKFDFMMDVERDLEEWMSEEELGEVDDQGTA